jgi:hypothetical protein
MVLTKRSPFPLNAKCHGVCIACCVNYRPVKRHLPAPRGHDALQLLQPRRLVHTTPQAALGDRLTSRTPPPRRRRPSKKIVIPPTEHIILIIVSKRKKSNRVTMTTIII